jgi:hypothetical protein
MTVHRTPRRRSRTKGPGPRHACDTAPMARIDPESLADDDGAPAVDLARSGRDQDGVASLRDTDAEAGDENEIVDDFDMDDREARELGVDLDDRDEPEPGFG